MISAHLVSPARRIGFQRRAALAAACFGVGLGLALTPGKASALTFTNYTTVNGLGSNSVQGVYASGSTSMPPPVAA